MSTPPLVSILVINHNYGRYLPAALDSALAQDYEPKEIVVVDDGSSDDSRARLRAYDGRVVSLLKANGGQGSAINAGVEACRGDVVACLDGDDAFRPGKVAAVVEAFLADAAAWVFHELDYMDEAGDALPLDALGPAHAAEVRARRSRYPERAPLDLRPAFAAGRRLGYTMPAFSGLSFRWQALRYVLPYPTSIGPAGDEYPKWAAAGLFRGAHIGRPLAVQRLHAANAATGRGDAAAHALRYLKTAYHLRRRFPQLAPTTDKLFAAALGDLLGANAWQDALCSEGRAYLRLLGVRAGLAQTPRVLGHLVEAALAPRKAAPARPLTAAGGLSPS